MAVNDIFTLNPVRHVLIDVLVKENQVCYLSDMFSLVFKLRKPGMLFVGHVLIGVFNL